MRVIGESYDGDLNLTGVTVEEDGKEYRLEIVRYGRWLKTCVPDVYMCSCCKRPTKMDELCKSLTLRDYCPNCGAKMDAKEA